MAQESLSPLLSQLIRFIEIKDVCLIIQDYLECEWMFGCNKSATHQYLTYKKNHGCPWWSHPLKIVLLVLWVCDSTLSLPNAGKSRLWTNYYKKDVLPSVFEYIQEHGNVSLMTDYFPVMMRGVYDGPMYPVHKSSLKKYGSISHQEYFSSALKAFQDRYLTKIKINSWIFLGRRI